MADLEKVLSEANAQIDALLASDLPSLAPMFQALAGVEPFLPVQNPTPRQARMVREYRENLERLAAGMRDLTARLQAERARILARRSALKAARAYQQ